MVCSLLDIRRARTLLICDIFMRELFSNLDNSVCSRCDVYRYIVAFAKFAAFNYNGETMQLRTKEAAIVRTNAKTFDRK